MGTNPESFTESSDAGQVYALECRLASRQMSRGEPTVYEYCGISGTFRGPRRRRDWADRNQAKGTFSFQRNNYSLTTSSVLNAIFMDATGDRSLAVVTTGGAQSGNGYTEPLFIAMVRLLQSQRTLPPLTMIESTKDIYLTRHDSNGVIIQTDHRISTIAGYLSCDVMGKSAFGYIYDEDRDYAFKAQTLSEC